MTVCLGTRPRIAEVRLACTRRRRSECGRMDEEPLRSPRDVRLDADIRLDHVQAVLTPAVRSIGTIEGELEGLIVHGDKRFLLYDRLTGRRVTCYFGDSVSWDGRGDVFGKRVAVTGEIRSLRSGERASINVSKYYVFPHEDDLPSAEEVRGLLGNVEPPLIIGKPNIESSLPVFGSDAGEDS